MATKKLTSQILLAAIDGFEAQKTRIDAQIAEIRRMLRGEKQSTTIPEPAATGNPVERRRRKLSRAGRAAIVAALKKGWAAKKAAAQTPEPTVAKNAAVKKAVARKARPVVAKAPAKPSKTASAKKVAPAKKKAATAKASPQPAAETAPPTA
jgi:hypothetical protein